MKSKRTIWLKGIAPMNLMAEIRSQSVERTKIVWLCPDRTPCPAEWKPESVKFYLKTSFITPACLAPSAALKTKGTKALRSVCSTCRIRSMLESVALCLFWRTFQTLQKWSKDMMGAAREAGLYDYYKINVRQSRKQADGTLKLPDCRHRECKTAASICDDMI